MTTVARRLIAPALAALAIASATALRADDGFRPIFHPPTFQIRDAQVKTSFKGLDGKTQPAGVYDLEVSQGARGILIGLLKNGKRVGEATGKFVPPAAKAGMADGSVRPSGGATQAQDFHFKTGAAVQQDFHFDVSSRVSFGDGGGAGKIFLSNNLHPGGANAGWIEFQVPPGPPSAR